MALKLLLVDDHAILLDGMKSILKPQSDYEVIATATSGDEAIEKLANLKVDILVTDLSMPGMDGLQLIQQARAVAPKLKVVVLSLHDDAHRIKSAIKLKINAYVLKSETSNELATALEHVKNGKLFVSNRINERLFENMNKPTSQSLLSTREIQILKLISEEFTNAQIADQLHISERTVETHRKNIYRKAGTDNLVGLIKFAYANQII